MFTLNKFQKIVAETMADGDYSHLCNESWPSREAFVAHMRNDKSIAWGDNHGTTGLGDLLLGYTMIELSEGNIGENEGVEAAEAAIRLSCFDLEDILNALANSHLQNYVPPKITDGPYRLNALQCLTCLTIYDGDFAHLIDDTWASHEDFIDCMKGVKGKGHSNESEVEADTLFASVMFALDAAEGNDTFDQRYESISRMKKELDAVADELGKLVPYAAPTV